MSQSEKEPLTFRMYSRIRFNRAIDPSKDNISPGGYAMKMGEKMVSLLIEFDFEDYEGNVGELPIT